MVVWFIMEKLYVHQQRFVDSGPDKCLIAHACGTGKTITALYTAFKRVDSCLIICPKGVKTKWREAIKAKPTCEFRVMTKEEFRKICKELPPYTGIIVDEAHHFSSTKSQLHKGLVAYIKKWKIEYIWLLTATPYRREPMNIYALAKILGHKWDYIGFRHKYYYEQYFGPKVVWLPKKDMEKEIGDLVRKIGDVVSFEECGDLPEIQHKFESFEITASQKQALEELELTEANPLVFYMREHQIMSGIGAKTPKNDYMLDLAESTGKLAVFCRYTAQIEQLRDMFIDAGYNTYIIDGSTKDKEKVANEVESKDKAVVIIQMDSAEGFELPSVSTIVFASMSYSYLAYEQSMGRFIRINKKNTPKLFIYLITNDSIDESVYNNLMNKQDFSLEIYAKNRS